MVVAGVESSLPQSQQEKFVWPKKTKQVSKVCGKSKQPSTTSPSSVLIWLCALLCAIATMKAVSASLSSSLPVRFLTQAEAVAIDVSLMKEDEEGFSVDQLMELAGLSVASAIGRHFFFSSPPLCAPSSRRCLVIAGPGNNGGDGLVAARHLFHMGAKVSVFYPKQKREVALYGRLVRQCERLQIPFLSQLPAEDLSNHFDLVVDAIFGYSFNGEIREPFAKIISALSRHPRVASIDIPSGWDVEKGDVLNTGLVIQFPRMVGENVALLTSSPLIFRIPPS